MCVGVCRGASPFPVRPCGRTRCSRYASGLRAPADVRLGRCPWNAVFRNPPRTVDFDRSSAVRVARLGGGWAVSPRGPRLASPAPPRVLSSGRPPPPPRLYGVGDGFSPSLGAVVRLLPRGGVVAFGEGFLNVVRLKRRPLSRSPRLVFSPRPAARCGGFLRGLRACFFLIDVVTSRSPGPGLSRAGRGTDIPGEWDRSSRSARGPLSSPSPPGWRCAGRKGVRNPARPRSFASLPLGATAGRVVFLTQRTLSARLFLAVSRGRPLPAAGRGVPPTRRALPPGRASAFRFGPLVAPGALRVVAQVPEAEQVLSSPVPRELFPLGVARCGGALLGGAALGGGVPAGQGRHARVPRPRVRGGAGPPPLPGWRGRSRTGPSRRRRPLAEP